MREFRLNRWQRIFLVLSIIWIVIGGSWGWRHAYDQVDADFKTCVAAVKTASDLESCRATRNSAIAIPRGVHAAIVAFGPLVIVWLAVYGPILLLRRIRRRPHASISAEQVELAPVQEASAIVDGGQREGAAMTDEAPGEERQRLAAKLRDFGGWGRDTAHTALRETLNWSAYQWTVLALLTAIFLLIALSYGGIRAELDALKQNAGASAQDRTSIEAAFGRQVSDLKSGFTKALADMKSALEADIAELGAKHDARSRALHPATPRPRPAARPRPQ
ncbi:MAG: hypothetical protein H7X78_07820 [Methyloceanibacter sp.]|nr:hypothetical protein [Methyloceanibacter sp.]